MYTLWRAASTCASRPSICCCAPAYAAFAEVMTPAASSRERSASDCALPARLHRQARRLATGIEIANLGLDLGAANGERFSLMAIEFELLLPAIDVELARVRVFAYRRCAVVGLGLRQAQAPQLCFDFGKTRRSGRLALARQTERRARAFDARRQLAILARKEHLLPAPVLVAQPLVAARLRRLPLERAALLFDLEDDVVDANQVLLRGLELQLRGAAPRPVLGDAGGFFDQLTAVGRPRAENHADLALLDDRVGLRAEAGVHQQFVHVTQAAHFAVDQVLALTRAVQPSRHLDVTGERRRQLLESRPRRDRCRYHWREPRAHVHSRWRGRRRPADGTPSDSRSLPPA